MGTDKREPAFRFGRSADTGTPDGQMQTVCTEKDDPRASGRIRLRITPSAVLFVAGAVVCTWLGVSGGISLSAWSALLAAAVLHEGGHLLAARLAGVRVSEVRLDLFGARMRLAGLLSYRQELVVALGGPAVNLLSALLVSPVWAHGGEAENGWLFIFLCASCGLCAVNLLPVQTLDGGRALSCLLSLTVGERAARITLRITTGVVLLFLWLVSVYALLRAGNMLSLFVFFFLLLLRSVGGEA